MTGDPPGDADTGAPADADADAAARRRDLAEADTLSASPESAPAPSTPGGRSAADTSPSARGTVVVGPGAALGRYQIGDELGAGGMATVYRARDPQLRREVAIKVMFPHLARKPEVARRFQREARAAAGLEHPNILRVYDVGGGRVPGQELDEPPYIVMELVRGESLRELVERTGPLLAEVVASIGAVLCDALAVAHAAGVIHRDIKPANVMVADDGRLLLADFGVARIDDDDSLVTKTGALLGTPAFMSPEQAHGGELDGRSDLYSVGAALYQLATGSLPFAGPTAVVVAAITRGELVPPMRRRPQVGAELSRAITTLMARDPAARPATAAAAAAMLRKIAADGGFGEPREELPAFVRDPDGFERARRPVVAARLVERAREARAARALPRALALLDRVLALEPDHAEARRLADELARAGERRRWVLGALALAGLGAGAGGAWLAMSGRSGGAVPDGRDPDAAVVAIADADGGAPAGRIPDEAASDGGAPSGRVPDEAASDGGAPSGRVPDGPPDASVLAGRNPHQPPDASVPAGRKPDASVPAGRIPDAGAAGRIPDAGVPAGRIPDATVAPVDAAPAPPAKATLSVELDAWCDLSIDGEPRGRADRKRRYDVDPGAHEVTCTQGTGMPTWSTTVTLDPGEHRTLKGSLLPDVRVTVDVAGGDAVRVAGTRHVDGATFTTPPKRIRVEIVRGSSVVAEGWISIPRVAACTLRDRPDLECAP